LKQPQKRNMTLVGDANSPTMRPGTPCARKEEQPPQERHMDQREKDRKEAKAWAVHEVHLRDTERRPLARKTKKKGKGGVVRKKKCNLPKDIGILKKPK